MTKQESKKKTLKQQLEEANKKIEELTDTLQRTQADFQNYKQRVERDKQQQSRMAGERLLKRFLPIMDNLELALQHADDKSEFYKGIEMIYANIRELLEEEGVNVIEPQGLPFDPHRHEALMAKESEQEKNTVIEVMQKGYLMHDKVLRPAKVAISKGQSGKQGGTKNE
ncbi:MAG: nucleotide exchange factor GrpE [Candidatus Woesearchaeota archaeon]